MKLLLSFLLTSLQFIASTNAFFVTAPSLTTRYFPARLHHSSPPIACSADSITAAVPAPEEENLKNSLFQLSVGDHNINEGDVIHRRPTKMKIGADLQDGGDCYFVTDGSVKFRHEGKQSAIPETFFLCSRLQEVLEEKVLISYSASGSGKTVDLAGSSVSPRGADLTPILISMRYQTEIEPSIVASMNILQNKIEKALEFNANLITLAESFALKIGV